ncbi:Com family DNA-binding transcriptional regulator [Yersinia enterocolitica]|uniref:Com family DNA-binding transcriptional regulator n=1 Tax=Yersinia enterocolitica TaxID=630 RepID=UPI001C60F6DF|nr:Com family DNA-binding transcriptional regulator [Yersinia enterocolitica]MBW5877234.1 Com family DNA-binding transcriptional regulator [Yersinia enterocolitica]
MPQNVRCKHCNKLLARASFEYIEVKCPHCKTLNQITLSATEHPTKARNNVRGEQHITITVR